MTEQHHFNKTTQQQIQISRMKLFVGDVFKFTIYLMQILI